MTVIRILFQAIVGLVFASLSVGALSPLFASILDEGSAAPVALTIMAAILLLVAVAPTVRRAFGRALLFLGAAIFILPLSTPLLSGVVMHQTVSTASTDAEAVGGAVGGLLAGGLMTGFAGVIGFFVGGVCLLFGLILSLGGRREVVVVRR